MEVPRSGFAAEPRDGTGGATLTDVPESARCDGDRAGRRARDGDVRRLCDRRNRRKRVIVSARESASGWWKLSAGSRRRRFAAEPVSG